MTEIAAKTGKDATSDKRIVVVLRQMIIDGKLAADEKISEVGVSNMFAVSRTPARLALRALEVEGLIHKREGRGFTVLKLNFTDLSKAYEVRGVLEGLAAGSLAKSEPSKQILAVLRAAVEDMANAIDSAKQIAERATEYQEANTVFHETIMKHCGNEFIGYAYSRMESLPLVKIGTLVFNSDKDEGELMRLRFGNMQHRLILDAIEKRDAQRAETLMREHALQIPVYSSLLV